MSQEGATERAPTGRGRVGWVVAVRVQAAGASCEREQGIASAAPGV